MTLFKKILFLMLITLYPQIGSGFDFIPLSTEDVDKFKMKITVPLHEINSSEDSSPTSSSSTSAPKKKDVSFHVFFEPYGATLTNILPTRFPISIGTLLDSFLNERGLSVFLSDLVVSTTEYQGAICLDTFTKDFLHKSRALRNIVLGRVCQKNPILMQCLTDVFNFEENPQAPTITLHNFRQLCTLLAYALGGEPPKERKDGQGFNVSIRGEGIAFKETMTPDKLTKRMRIYLTRTLELTFDQQSQQLVLGAPAE